MFVKLNEKGRNKNKITWNFDNYKNKSFFERCFFTFFYKETWY